MGSLFTPALFFLPLHLPLLLFPPFPLLPLGCARDAGAATTALSSICTDALDTLIKTGLAAAALPACCRTDTPTATTTAAAVFGRPRAGCSAQDRPELRVRLVAQALCQRMLLVSVKVARMEIVVRRRVGDKGRKKRNAFPIAPSHRSQWEVVLASSGNIRRNCR